MRDIPDAEKLAELRDLDTREPRDLEDVSIGEAVDRALSHLARTEKLALSRAQYRRDYLRSDEWKWTRKQAIRYHGTRCHDCHLDAGRYPDVHHVTYDRLGNENIVTDLVVLCRRCHDKRHEVPAPPIGDKDGGRRAD